MQQSENGEYFTTIQASCWDAFYLFGGQEIPRMLQWEVLVFYGTFVSLRGHIFASIEKLVHLYEMWKMNCLWLTQIYLYRWYIPDLIQLVNDMETNLDPAVVDNIDSSKAICTPSSQLSAVFNWKQNIRKSTRNHKANKNTCCV